MSAPGEDSKMKTMAVLTILALVFTWVGPVAAAHNTAPALPAGDGLPRGDTVSPDVIGVIAVLTAYALLWGAFAVALKIRALMVADEDGSASNSVSGTISG
jgi:hypothetical protein